MKTIEINASWGCAPTIDLGQRGENLATEVRFDFAGWAEEFGAPGAVELYVRRAGETTPYPVALTIEDTVAVWPVSAIDTHIIGLGEAELVYLIDGAVVKTAVYGTSVEPDIGKPDGTPPDPYETWMEELGEMAAGTLINAQRAETALDGAEAAQTAAEAAQTAAETAQEAAEAAQTGAEAAQTAAEAAQTASETAQAAAETAQGIAQTSAQSAAADAASAQVSATNAANSASSASASAIDARQSVASAASAATNASIAAQTATSKANAASNSAEAAQVSANRAGASATAAANSATAAAASASSANSSASSAAQSATAAAASASAAAASETAAGASATAAQSAQTAAEAAQSAAEAVAASIPEDYSAMSAEVANLQCASAAVKREQTISIPVTVTNGKAVLYKTGGLISSSVFGYTDYIDVRLYESVTLKRLNLQATSVTSGIAFYDKDKNYLWGLPCIKGQESVSYFDDTIALTDDIAYVRCTTHSDTETFGEFTITGKSKNIEMLYGYPFEPFCPFVALKSINPNSGAEGASSSATYYCHTDYVDCHGFDFVRYTRVMATGSDPVHGLAFYDENKNFLVGSGQPYGANAEAVHVEVNDFRIPADAYYVRFSYYVYDYIRSYGMPDFSASLIKVGNLENRISRIDGESPVIDGLYPYKPKSQGIENAIRRAHALSRLKWTPVGEVTRQIKPIGGAVSASKFNAGVTYTGSPYSVTYQRNRNIGIEVSIDTFESVVSNAGTRIYDPSLNTKYAYFGNVCSSFVAYAVGMMAAPLTEVMAQFEGMQFVAPGGAWNESSLELGSILLKPDDHVVIVTGILTDASGTIQFVEITEATLNGYIQGGKVISRWYTPTKLLERFSAYGLYWYSHIDECEYRQSNFAQVYPEPESAENAKFMCLSAFGDGTVFGNNNTAAEVLIDSNAYADGFRYLRVYINGTLANSYEIASDTTVVSVPKSADGVYYLVLDDGNGVLSRPTRWRVYEATFSKTIDGTTLTLTYNTDATVFGISYITGTSPNDVELFEPCNVTGTGTIEFTVQSDARSVNVIFGDKNGAVHRSI